MKKLQLLAVTFCFTAALSAQDLKSTEVPTKLNNQFQKEYTKARDVEWEMSGEDYKVEFEIDRKDHEIWYSKSGKVMRMEQELHKKDLPSAVTAAIEKQYADYNIDDSEMVKVKGKSTYVLDLEKGWTEERKVTFDEKGKVLSDRRD